MARYPESTKHSLEQRLGARPAPDGPSWPASPSVTAANFTYLDGVLPDGTTLKLCRLRYVGSAHTWRFAIYRASHDDYAESIFPTGLPVGTCEDALDTAAGLYLGDPTAWTH